jgi:hypothetical protein
MFHFSHFQTNPCFLLITNNMFSINHQIVVKYVRYTQKLKVLTYVYTERMHAVRAAATRQFRSQIARLSFQIEKYIH